MNRYYCTILVLLLFSCQENKVLNEKNPHEQKVDDLSLINSEELESFQLDVEKDTLKVIVFGHVHSLMEFTTIRKKFYSAINNEKPDIVFMAGDIVFYNQPEEWNKLKAEFSQFTVPYFITPGNHDFGFYEDEENGISSTRKDAQSRFLKEVGYRYKKINTKFADISLINTNDQLQMIDKFIAAQPIDTAKTNVIITHHNLFVERQRYDSIPTSWTGTYFKRTDLLQRLTQGDVFINGDWNLKFDDREAWIKSKKVRSILVGNRMKNDPLFFTILSISSDTIISNFKEIEIDSTSHWYIH